MPNYKGAKCFVVTLMYGGYKHYLKRVETIQGAGASLPTFAGYFSISLLDAQKFLNDYEARYFASHFEGAQVETIKTGEVLKSDRK